MTECVPGERVSVQLHVSAEGDQHFFVHHQCLRNVVHTDLPLLAVEDYEQDWPSSDVV
jgi:hypothetical protein